MQMEQYGIPEQEKVFTFSIPAERGLSYKKVNREYKNKFLVLSECWDFIDKSVAKGDRELVDTEDIVKRVLNNISDLWISVKDGDVVGAFVVGVIAYPKADVINFEAISGKFNFKYALPKVEDHYISLGYKHFQMIGRKGWQKVMSSQGYIPKSTTIFKKV